MKKVFVILALLLVCVAFGQKTDSFHVVQPGDNAWDLATQYYSDPYRWGEVPNHGIYYRASTGWFYAKLSPGDTFFLAQSTLPLSVAQASSPDPTSPEVVVEDCFAWWPIFLLVAIMLAFLFFFRLRDHRRGKIEDPWIKDPIFPLEDPITAGPPQVPGGVQDAGATERIYQLARERFPEANLVISNIRRGRLSGLARVHYAEDQTKTLLLKQIIAYAGDVKVEGEEKPQTIYFLQGCGNDACAGRYMEGEDLVFTPEAEIPFQEAPVAEEAPATTATPTSPEKESFEDLLISEILPKIPNPHKITVRYKGIEIEIIAKREDLPREGSHM